MKAHPTRSRPRNFVLSCPAMVSIQPNASSICLRMRRLTPYRKIERVVVQGGELMKTAMPPKRNPSNWITASQQPKLPTSPALMCAAR